LLTNFSISASTQTLQKRRSAIREAPEKDDEDLDDYEVEPTAYFPSDTDLEMEYEGELDQNSKPHGKGRAAFTKSPMTYEGDFLHGDFHGHGVLVVSGDSGFR